MAAETFRRSLRKHRNSSISTSSPSVNAASTKAPAKVDEFAAVGASSNVGSDCVRPGEVVDTQQSAASGEHGDSSESLAAAPSLSMKTQGSILSRVFQKQGLHSNPAAAPLAPQTATVAANNAVAVEISLEYRSHFSASQAEELISQFQQSDADGSGAIDEQEFRALLPRMSIIVTDAEAAELVDSIDTDGNGLIDFREIVGMVIRIKTGDERFRALKKFVDALDTTPIALLEREASTVRDEIARSERFERELNDDEQESAAIEDTDENRPSRERRRVSQLVYRTVERMKLDLELCRWGCALWFPRVRSLEVHEREECERRRMWRQMTYDHEAENQTLCDSRIIYCPRDCGVWMPHLELDHHMRELCMKRPVGDLRYRLGCGVVYQGGAHQLLTLEQTRIAHEQDDCPFRKVECTWPRCKAAIIAKERNAHRRNHLISLGVVSFLTAEVHEYKVPKDMKLLKIQVWGTGGGSGHLKGQMVGHGGGGAFVEGVCKVFPGETLYISIGSGGSSGKYARLKQCEYEEEETTESTGTDKTTLTKKSKRIETFVGIANGGYPGGGRGYSDNKECACGGGGGFTSVYREGAYGVECLLIAARGGAKDGDELRTGRPGGDSLGGHAGECDEQNPICCFLGTDGVSMQGGDGAEFGGGGGGGGLFGGGGGGFAPGIVGGDGGGSSFANAPFFESKSVHVEPGDVVLLGGMRENPPQSVRGAYWDVVDDVVGEGGTSTVTSLENGNHGGVRPARPGFFNDMKFHH
ncbi:Serine/threonine-protein phosphatase 6 regulatory ankyrin repeat subunit, partial [Globisporangium splendens]